MHLRHTALVLMPIHSLRIALHRPALWAVLLLGWVAMGCKDGSSRRPFLPADAGPSTLALRGKLIFDATPAIARAYTGDLLSCGDCHLQSGTAAYALPMIDVAGLFPRFSRRAGRTITLVDRIQECFVRSENGAPPPASSSEMRALVAYIGWLSRRGRMGVPYRGRGLVQLATLTGNPHAGRRIYRSRCAGCHGADGAGMAPALPPLWGAGSFSDAAGMSRIPQMAAFVQHNMPPNAPGSLTPRQAYDVAAYVAGRPRPKLNQAYQSY